MKDEARRVEDYHHDLISLRLKNVKSQRMDNLISVRLKNVEIQRMNNLISLRLKNVKSQRMDNTFNRFLVFTHLEKVVYLQ